MLDVHSPHHRLEGFRDFLIHLLTITVGLLIAVGIEGCVERHHEHNLARDARETLHREIESNSKQMTDALAGTDKNQTLVKDDIDFLTRLRKNPNDKSLQKGSLTANFSFTRLDDTAWKTAQATGALGFMPYEEANKYSNIYGAQNQFEASQEKIAEDVAQFFGIIQKEDFDKEITAEGASAVLERLGIMQGHLLMVDALAKDSAAIDKAFLAGKDVTEHFHEELKK
ncbi:hypothetical protein AciX8_0345 [Granulicella mallensis MP5ACTX8]|uniref:Uncharacterized protein n=1 Tax=Granulicella mallensis (strain ATCC BAA-1857 / DSM 23137 / MP5ACTX8) TaxID=682795 RepID=G8P1G1_GRAMM|nr:hypothetical protein AciX8_0345 [Granulicella mallensis MP5ACTX8]